MAAKSLRCVALAYRACEPNEVPTDAEQLAQWTLPEDDLVLLAIVGIKVINLEETIVRKPIWNIIFLQFLHSDTFYI